ncbi:MAG: hypothetical protein MJZ21_00925 [archaeon]|nr:hypothetical protein [archaeon]
MSDEYYDPNAALFAGEEPEQKSEEQEAFEYVYGRNPNRVSALTDLWFENLMTKINEMELPSEEAKMKMIFKLTAGGILDMLGDSQAPGVAPDVMCDLDMFMGLALTNLRFKVDLLREQQKALQTIDPDQFENDEEYVRALSDAEDAWWDIAQPMLDKRNPRDAIKETLRKYGLE